MRLLQSAVLAAFASVALAAAAQNLPDFVYVDGFDQDAPLAFRMTDLRLRDPHIFVTPGFGCFDVTDNSLPGISSFNDQLQTLINTDGNGDGYLDLSSLLLFRPLRQDGVPARLDTTDGLCVPPANATSCAPDPATLPVLRNYATLAAGTCLSAIPGTTGGYSPGVPAPAAPCFLSDARDTILNFNGTLVPVYAAQVGAETIGTPATQLQHGLTLAFLREADADVVQIGTSTLASLLPGGTGNCSSRDDRDMYLGESGWWLYLEFSAAPVPYSGN